MCLENNTENEIFLYYITSLWKIANNKKFTVLQSDNKLDFKSRISELYKKASQKIAA